MNNVGNLKRRNVRKMKESSPKVQNEADNSS